MADIEPLRFEGLARQLESRIRLSPDDRAAIMALPHTIRMLEPGAYLAREGEPPQGCAVLLDGFMIRQKTTGDGDRQIVGLHIPGDPLDFQMLFLAVADHNVQALTRATIASIPRAAVEALIAERPGVARAVTIYTLAEASIAREWLLNIGRRDARSRLAHLLCEFATRMDAQGIGGDGDYELPMTQEQLGDALGLTSVHVNRTLRALEQEGYITRSGRRLQFARKAALGRLADFTPRYLHLTDVEPDPD